MILQSRIATPQEITDSDEEAIFFSCTNFHSSFMSKKWGTIELAAAQGTLYQKNRKITLRGNVVVRTPYGKIYADCLMIQPQEEIVELHGNVHTIFKFS